MQMRYPTKKPNHFPIGHNPARLRTGGLFCRRVITPPWPPWRHSAECPTRTMSYVEDVRTSGEAGSGGTFDVLCSERGRSRENKGRGRGGVEWIALIVGPGARICTLKVDYAIWACISIGWSAGEVFRYLSTTGRRSGRRRLRQATHW